MDPLSVTASIIAILQLTSKVIEYLNDVKDAPKDRAQCAIEASNLYNLLTMLRYRLEEGASNERWYQAVRALGVEHGPLNQYKLLLEQLQAKIIKERGMKKVGYLFLWKFIKEEVLEILARIERLKTLVQIALEMDHFKLSLAIGKGVDVIQQEQNRRRHDEILEWISPIDFPAQQSDFIARRQEGTGLWFLDSTEFTEWIHGLKKTLFCPGIPGAGKTMMAAITINYLQQTVQSDNIGVAYLYCNYNAQADQTTTNLLTAILKQLVQARPSTIEPVARLHDHHVSQRTRPSPEEVFSALQSILTSHSSVYLVVDAFDECPDQGTRSQLLHKLCVLQSKLDLRLMVTSRFIPEIVNEFSLAPTLEVRASEADVKQFVKGQMYQLPNCVQRDDALQVMVQEKLVEAVDGMFLLARLHFDSLLDKNTKKKVQSTLNKLSKSFAALDQAYDEAIKRIKGQLPGKSVLAKSVLSWITYAERPLTTGELCHALAVELGEDELDPDNIPDVEDLVSVCAGLVTVDQGSNIIRLVHYTTQEYLKRIRENWNPTAQQDIASTCLTYLTFNTFKSGSCASDKDFNDRVGQNAFIDYAARYWGQHAFTVQQEVSELALSLLQDSNLVSSVVQVMSVSKQSYRYSGYSQSYPTESVGLHLTARFGLLHLSRKLLHGLGEDDVEADSKDGYGQTPLSWAARRGHKAVVKLLVEKGVDLDSKDRHGRTPLSYAVGNGHEVVVELLVEKGVDLDTKDRHGRTLLSWAAENGREVVVKQLIEKGVDLDSKSDTFGQTPLSWAAEKGHEAVVKLLVEKGVDLDWKDRYDRTPLSWAAENGHEAVVKLLVEKDVDLDSKDRHGRTPLSYAVGNGHEVVVKLLVEKGVDLDTKDRHGRTPLVEKATELEGKDTKYGQTPLSWAAENADEAAVEYPQVVSRKEWLDVRKALLIKEKEATYTRDALSTKRRNLPMVEIDKAYTFESPDGKATLLDLFNNRRQLIIYHFMFDPALDAGCRNCSFLIDSIGPLDHLRFRNTNFAAVSHAPVAKIEGFKKRMCWRFPWYSCSEIDFNYDFRVTQDEAVTPVEYNSKNKEKLEEDRIWKQKGEQAGITVFICVKGKVYHTYSTCARGLDHLMFTYSLLDLTPFGRQDGPLKIDEFSYHDGY